MFIGAYAPFYKETEILKLQETIEDMRALRDALNAALLALESRPGAAVKRASGGPPATATVKPVLHWTQTEKGRTRMAEILRERYAAKASAKAPGVHWSQTPQGRKRMAEIARKRQQDVRKGGKS